MANVNINEYITEPRAHSLYVAFLQSGLQMKEFAELRSLSYDCLNDWFRIFRKEEGQLIKCRR